LANLAKSEGGLVARIVYCVVLHHGEWIVKLLGDMRFGPYKTQKDAILAAIEAAQAAGNEGSHVRVQGPDNEFRTEWAYGHDPYLPRDRSGCGFGANEPTSRRSTDIVPVAKGLDCLRHAGPGKLQMPNG
jgi:hypothetical protein